jgi:hypothetical protein
MVWNSFELSTDAATIRFWVVASNRVRSTLWETHIEGAADKCTSRAARFADAAFTIVRLFMLEPSIN